jgi:hypothetical protein
MNKTIKQVDFNEAIELTKAGEQVLAITVIKKPSIKAFRNLLISEAVSGNYIFQCVEGGSDE